MSQPVPVPDSKNGLGRSAAGRLRALYSKAAAFRAALLVFLLIAALIGAVEYTLSRNAERSSMQQASTELAGASRVAASSFSALRANLRAHASQEAASLDLQRAVIVGDRGALARIAAADQVRIVSAGRAYGKLAQSPRIASTALITSNGHVLAHVTVSAPLGDQLLQLVRDQTPLPSQAALVLAQNGRVVAGGPRGAPATIRNGRVVFGSIKFVARSAGVGIRGTTVLAVEPVRTVGTDSVPYRRRLLLAGLLTLVLAAGVATRLGRPVARLLNDVSRLTHQAQTDGLTGLANRSSLDVRLAEEVENAARLGNHLTFVLADVDNFKLVNDRYGHKTGDDALRVVGRAFVGSVRELDLAARYGGEEFALVLPGTDLSGAERIVERIRKTLSESSIEGPDKTRVAVTVSFGLAAFPTFSTSEALVEAADAALYEAKREGKDRAVSQRTEPAHSAAGSEHVAAR